MTFRALALTAVTAGAVGISGCGDDNSSSNAGGSGSSDPNTLLVSTFKPGANAKIKSGTIELKISGQLSGNPAGSGEASAIIKLNDAEDGEIPEFSAEVDVDGEQKGGQKIDFQAGGVFTDDRFYVNYDGESYDVGEELSKRAMASLKQSIEQSNSGSSTESKELLGQFGLSPDTWLKDPKVDGEDKIGGVDTYKITGQVDIKAIVPDILEAAKKAQALTPGGNKQQVPEVSAAELDKVSKQIEKLDVAIWTGKDDNILRQVTVDLAINGTKESDKIEGKVQLTLTDVNEEQDIKAPSDTKPITDLMPKLGGLFGAVSGAGGLGGASSVAPPGATSAVSEAYVRCVNEAGGDAAKLNACQAQLPK
ncbi:MAG: hypothetical protein JHD16_03870 [Solirubrobacteraceae bacterium]|nr:hypothetical protein [Solirubrobacteraceae bacterium]